MAWDPVWETIFQGRPWGRYPALPLVRFVARHFFGAPDRSAVNILEVGCGPGANLWFIAREGFTVYGFDASPTALDKAKLRLDREVPGWKGSLRQGDFLDLPYADQTFDAVVDVEAITTNSFDDAIRVYQNISRVLKKDGLLFSQTFATGTHGDGTGTPVGYRSFVVAEGPLQGEGFTRFTAESDIPRLLGDLQLRSLEMITRSHDHLQHWIKEFIIVAGK